MIFSIIIFSLVYHYVLVWKEVICKTKQLLYIFILEKSKKNALKKLLYFSLKFNIAII